MYIAYVLQLVEVAHPQAAVSSAVETVSAKPTNKGDTYHTAIMPVELHNDNTWHAGGLCTSVPSLY